MYYKSYTLGVAKIKGYAWSIGYTAKNAKICYVYLPVRAWQSFEK
jgi:hypothetical protein